MISINTRYALFVFNDKLACAIALVALLINPAHAADPVRWTYTPQLPNANTALTATHSSTSDNATNAATATSASTAAFATSAGTATTATTANALCPTCTIQGSQVTGGVSNTPTGVNVAYITTVGTTTWTVPASTVHVRLWGAAGGCMYSGAGYTASAGTATKFNSTVIANGGQGASYSGAGAGGYGSGASIILVGSNGVPAVIPPLTGSYGYGTPVGYCDTPGGPGGYAETTVSGLTVGGTVPVVIGSPGTYAPMYGGTGGPGLAILQW